MNSKEHIRSTPHGAMSRRTFMGAMPVVGASVVIPTAALASAETANERVHRLALELAEALGDPGFTGYFPRVVVTAHGAQYTVNDLDIRIGEAAAQIAGAMAELHPDWRYPQIKHEELPAISGRGEVLRTVRHAVLVYASEEKYGPEEGMWWAREVGNV